MFPNNLDVTHGILTHMSLDTLYICRAVDKNTRKIINQVLPYNKCETDLPHYNYHYTSVWYNYPVLIRKAAKITWLRSEMFPRWVNPSLTFEGVNLKYYPNEIAVWRLTCNIYPHCYLYTNGQNVYYLLLISRLKAVQIFIIACEDLLIALQQYAKYYYRNYVADLKHNIMLCRKIKKYIRAKVIGDSLFRSDTFVNLMIN